MTKKSQLRTEDIDGVRCIYPLGSINAQNSERFSEQVEAAAGEWAGEKVVLALAGVEYVSSAALRVFMQLWQKGRAENCELILAEPGPDVREVLELTGFQNIFRIEKSVEEACS